MLIMIPFQSSEVSDNRRISGDRQKSPLLWRAQTGMLETIYRAGALNSLTVVGQDNFDDTDNKAAILAVDHSRDENLMLATIIASKHTDVAITGQSTHRQLETPKGLVGFGLYLLTRNRFIGVDTRWTAEKDHKVSYFNPNDTEPMLGALDQGRSVIMATHSPADTRPDKPIRPGYIGGLLALRSQAPIIPIAVRSEPAKSTDWDATVIVGEAYGIDPYDDIDAFLEAYKKRGSGEGTSLSKSETALIRDGLQRVKLAGQEIFDRTNSLLTEDKNK